MKPVTTLVLVVGFLALTAAISLNLKNSTSSFPKAATSEGIRYTQAEMDKYGLLLDPINCPKSYKVRTTKTTGKPICTHGPELDPARFPPTESENIKVFDSIQCNGDGQSGPRVQVLYVRASDIPEHFSSYWIGQYKSWTRGTNQVFIDSAKQTGGFRAIRFVHDANCEPIIQNIEIGPESDKDFGTIVDALISRGFNRTDRKYLIYMDAQLGCGQGTVANDDQPGSNNINNLGPDWAMVFKNCWFENDPVRTGDVAAHEVSHNLGAVQLSAPHTSGGWHCVDEQDNLCYSDSPYYPPMQNHCPSSNWNLLDCNHDDYYSTNTQPGTYIHDHWNSANSIFLIGQPNTPPPPTITLTPTTTPSVPINVKVYNKTTNTKYPSSLTIRATYFSACSAGCNSSCTDPVCTLGRDKTYSPSACGNAGCASWSNSQANSRYTMTVANLPTDYQIIGSTCNNWLPSSTNGRTCAITVEKKPQVSIQGYIWRDDNNLNAVKNKEELEPSVAGIPISLYKVTSLGSTFVTSTTSTVGYASAAYNFSFLNIPAANYQFGRPKLPTNLKFIDCNAIVPPTTIPSRFFYCQGLNAAGTKYRLFIKKWTPGGTQPFVDSGKSFTLKEGGQVNVDIPLVRKPANYIEREFEN